MTNGEYGLFTSDMLRSIQSIMPLEASTLNDTVKALEEITGKNKVSYGPFRNGDVKHSLADISKAQKLLKYRPSVNVKQGLIETIVGFLVKNKQDKVLQLTAKSLSIFFKQVFHVM